MDMHKDRKLRPYQLQAIEAIVGALKKNDRFCIQMAPGTGKSLVILGLLEAYLKKYRTLILVDRMHVGQHLYHYVKEEFGGHSSILISDSSDIKRSRKTPIVVSTVERAFNSESIVSEFDLILVDGVHSNKSTLDLYNLRDNAERTRAKLVFFTHYATKKDLEFYGEIVFKYDLVNAIEDGVLLPIEFILGPKADLDSFHNEEYILQLLDSFVRSFLGEPGRKAVIVCRSISEAELVLKACEVLPEAIRPVLIHSKTEDVQRVISDFRFEGRASVAVTVDMFQMLQSPKVSDIVLLRGPLSEFLFHRVISFVNRPKESKYVGRVWDFSRSELYFKEEMGQLTDDQRETEITAIDEKSSKPNASILEESSEGDGRGFSVSNPLSKKKLSNPCSDKPARVDLLGRKGLVSILKGLIDRESKKHLIVALFGRWGSGKSSVIELLGEAYSGADDNSYIIFNAWQAEHSNSMAASIANQLIDRLYESKGLADQVMLSLKDRLLNAKTSLLQEFTMAFLVAALGVGLVIPRFTEGLDPGSSTILVVSFFLSALFPIIKSYLKHPFTAKIRELSKRPDFNAHIGLGYTIRDQLSSLLVVYPQSFLNVICAVFGRSAVIKHKYVLVVDDLDRCSDEKIIETLEAIQLVVDLPGVSVILAVDHRVLLEAVAARYRKQRRYLSQEASFELAREYLGKILQITITLDRPSSVSRDNFIFHKLYTGVENKDEERDSARTTVMSSDQAFEKNDVDIMDFSDFFDDYHDDYDRSEEYLQDSHHEFEFFRRCAGIFDIHNPRALIRIHNSVTLLKGLYPDIADDKERVDACIYLSFWHEVFSTSTPKERGIMKNDLFDIEVLSEAGSPIVVLAQRIGLYDIAIKDRRRILYRVINMSLPSLDGERQVLPI